jgi:hypothetical protein
MKKIGLLILVFVLAATGVCFAKDKPIPKDKTLLLEDFESPISGGPSGTVDFGAGNGSTIIVEASRDIKHSGNQAIKVTYKAIPEGYMWVAKGFDLDASRAGWLVEPEDIKWEDYNAISFYMYGTNSKANIAFDIKDNGGEFWRFLVEDNFKGWRQIVIRFDKFFVRNDWQPDTADKNGELDLPLKSFQFEPRPEAKGIVYFDTVELREQ